MMAQISEGSEKVHYAPPPPLKGRSIQHPKNATAPRIFHARHLPLFSST